MSEGSTPADLPPPRAEFPPSRLRPPRPGTRSCPRVRADEEPCWRHRRTRPRVSVQSVRRVWQAGIMPGVAPAIAGIDVGPGDLSSRERFRRLVKRPGGLCERSLTA